MILGELEPDSGTIRRGANLQVAYSTSCATRIDLDATLEDFISPGKWIEINGTAQARAQLPGRLSVLAARAHSPVRSLSGGERNRLLLARLFARPPPCWCWTSPPTTWTSKPSTCWKNCCRLPRHCVPRQPRPHLSGQRGHQHHCLQGDGVGTNLKAAWKTGCSNLWQ